MFNTIHIPIRKIIIILYQDKLYEYFGLGIIISIVINPNTIKNTILIYYHLNTTIDYFSIFICLLFELNLDSFQKNKSLMLIQIYF